MTPRRRPPRSSSASLTVVGWMTRSISRFLRASRPRSSSTSWRDQWNVQPVAALDHGPQRRPTPGFPPRAHGTGEVEVVTVAFTDLEGFTSFTDTHGDDAAAAMISEQNRAAGPIVRRWHGRVVKHLGDGLLCTFPEANGGIRAALELLETSPSPLRLRAGLHVGEAVVTQDDVVGQVVNIAARVTETAKGNQVVVTAETARQSLRFPVPSSDDSASGASRASLSAWSCSRWFRCRHHPFDEPFNRSEK